jgi:hypothetical protein
MEMIAYFATFLIGIIFSLLSVVQSNEEEKGPLSVVCSVISSIVWMGLALFNIALLYDSIFLYLSWVFFGLAAVFLVWSAALTFVMIKDSAKSKPDEALVLR